MKPSNKTVAISACLLISIYLVYRITKKQRPKIPQYASSPSNNKIISNLVKRQNHATSLASIIPAFPDQTRCLIAQFRAAKQRFHSLLIEGDFGIGKGTSLEHWIEQEIKDRPCRYIRLSFLENPNIFETIEEDIEIDLRWREEIIQALGYTNDMDDFDDFDEIMHEITTSLIQLRPTLSKPPLLIIDDMNILFYKHQALTSKYGDLEITFEWLNNLQNKDLIDLVFCCSEKSVLGALTKFKGFQHLQYKNVDGVDDEAFLKYLVKENKFSESDALLFVYNFNGSLDELNKFVVLKRSNFILLRESDILKSFSSQSVPVESNHFKALILEMILKNGILPVNTLDAPKLDIVESLVEANLLKWRSGKEIKRDMGKDHDYVEVQALNDHPLAVFSRGDAELIWASPLLGRVLEAWFFQE